MGDAVPTGTGGNDPGQGAPPAPPAPPPNPGPTFTQADLDKIAGSARQEGRTAGVKELLDQLGVEDVEAAKARIQAAKEAEDAQKTEAQRLAEERDRYKAEAERAAQQASTLLAVTRLESALRDAGLKPDRLQAALRLADLNALTVEGTEVKGVAEAVEAVKATSPEWFGTPASPPDASLPPGGSADYRTDKSAAAKVLQEQYGIRV